MISKLMRFFRCSKGKHRFNVYPDGKGTNEIVLRWWDKNGIRVFGMHCKDCGHWQELVRK